MATRPYLSTMHADGDPLWNELVEVARPVGRPGGLRDLLHLWRASRGREALILRGSVSFADRYRDLVLVLLLKLRRRRPLVLLTDATWEVGSASLSRRAPWAAKLLPTVVRRAIRALDGAHVHYGVLSTEELATMPAAWGIPAERVVRTGFTHTLYDGAEHTPVHDGGYLFAGGNSLRDYALLERAVEGAPWPTVIAANWTSADTGITAGPVSHDRFLELMAGARACVVPIRTAVRSTGQQTYLNAMALGKPVVVTDAPGVRDYVQDGRNGFVAEADAAALRAALDRVMAPDRHPEVDEAAGRARREVLAEHDEFAYRRRLLILVGADVPSDASARKDRDDGARTPA